MTPDMVLSINIQGVENRGKEKPRHRSPCLSLTFFLHTWICPPTLVIFFLAVQTSCPCFSILLLKLSWTAVKWILYTLNTFIEFPLSTMLFNLPRNLLYNEECLLCSVLCRWVMSNSLQLHELYVVHQAPPCMGFPRWGYWSRLTFPSPGDLPNPQIEPTSLALAGRWFNSESLGKSSPHITCLRKATVLAFALGCPQYPRKSPYWAYITQTPLTLLPFDGSETTQLRWRLKYFNWNHRSQDLMKLRLLMSHHGKNSVREKW